MRRFTVMGFTEAELGFVLAALFAAVAVARMGEEAERESELVVLQQVVVERDSLALEHDRYRDSMALVLAGVRDSLRTAARSTKVPQCWEKGEQREPVAVVSVLGADLFLLGGERVDLDGVRSRLADRIAVGQELGCRFVVRAIPVSGVDVSSHSRAVWDLRTFFDVNDRPE